MKLLKYIFSLVAILLTACGGEDSGLPGQDNAASGGELRNVVSLQVTPASSTVPMGFTQQYLALALLSDGAVIDVTGNSAVSWSSSDPTIATIDSQGLATAIAPGSVTITAAGTANGQSFSASAQLTVTNARLASLQVMPVDASVVAGLTRQFTAIAYFSDGSSLDVTNEQALGWVSSNPSIASISTTGNKNKGLATGVSPGTVTITASGNADGQSFSATAQLTVSSATVIRLELTPASASVPVGITHQVIATAFLSDGTSQDVTSQPGINWSSSNSSIAVVDLVGGLVTGIAPGTVAITASGYINGQLLSDQAEVTVTSVTVDALLVTPDHASVPIGLTQQYMATALLSDGSSRDVTNDQGLTWVSSDTSIATISTTGDHGKGIVTGVTTGMATVTASFNSSGQSLSATAQLSVTDATVTSLQVTPARASVPAGFTQVYTATAFLSDGSYLDVTDHADLTWSSSEPGIATISSSGSSGNGIAVGISPGIASITALLRVNGLTVSAAAELTVTAAVVSNLLVTPATANVPVGLSQQYTAIANLSDGSWLDVTHEASLSWTSSDTSIATISGKGGATGIRTGTVTITASGYANGQLFTATAELNVRSATMIALQVTPATASVPVGVQHAYIATGIFSDGSSVDLTDSGLISWVSSDSAIALIDPRSGIATGVTPGTVTITASYVGAYSLSGTAQLTVTTTTVTGLLVAPATASVPAGLTQSYTATAQLSDGSSLDVTNDSSLGWSSSDSSIATINTVGSSKGVATGIIPGSVTINATLLVNGTSISNTASLTITNAIVTELNVTPGTASVSRGLTQRYIATARLSDGRLLDVTNQGALNWSSSDPAIATISTTGTKGVATGVMPGTVTITASGNNNGQLFIATAQLTVTTTTVTSLAVTPKAARILPRGLGEQYTAIATLSDGSSLNVNNDAALSWNSSDNAIATINASGVATGKAQGTTIITAFLNGLSDTASLQVGWYGVLSTSLTPNISDIGIGGTQQFTLTAKMENTGDIIDITDDPAVIWTSSDPGVATVSSGHGYVPGGNGIARGGTAGIVDISAGNSSLPPPTAAKLTVNDTPKIVYISANGVRFSLSDGFPSTGFIGAIFRLVVSGSPSDYDFSSDAAWAQVDANGDVHFISEGNAIPVTITATPKSGDAPTSYTFALDKWFITSGDYTDWSTAWDTCNAAGLRLPLTADGTLGFNVRAVGALASEWRLETSVYPDSDIPQYFWTAEQTAGAGDIYRPGGNSGYFIIINAVSGDYSNMYGFSNNYYQPVCVKDL